MNNENEWDKIILHVTEKVIIILLPDIVANKYALIVYNYCT